MASLAQWCGVRVLLLTQRLPYAPNRGDRLRAFHEIRHLQAAGWTVDVLALVHDDEEAGQVAQMRAAGLRIEVARLPHLRNKVSGVLSLAGSTPLTLTLLHSPDIDAAIARLLDGGRPAVVLAFSSSMAAVAMRPALRTMPLVVDLVDVDSEKWRALAASSRWPMSWIYRREHRTLQTFERLCTRRAYATTVVTDRERDALLAFAPGAQAMVVPNGIDLSHFARPADVRIDARVVFTGVMNYEPNADAAVWLGRDIWPRVRARCPDARLDIVGATPAPAVQALQDEALGVTVTGSVPDVRPYLWRAKTAVAPLRIARGVQNKVLEAAAAGIPCVVSPSVRAGLPTALADLCPVADTAAAFADALIDLLDAPPDHDRWVAAVASLDWAAALAPLPRLLTAAALARSLDIE